MIETWIKKFGKHVHFVYKWQLAHIEQYTNTHHIFILHTYYAHIYVFMYINTYVACVYIYKHTHWCIYITYINVYVERFHLWNVSACVCV